MVRLTFSEAPAPADAAETPTRPESSVATHGGGPGPPDAFELEQVTGVRDRPSNLAHVRAASESREQPSEPDEPIDDNAAIHGGVRMSVLPFLLVSAVPLPDLARTLSFGRPPPAASADFREAARAVRQPGVFAGVFLADLPSGARQRASLRVLESLRGVDKLLPAALVTDSPNERLIRAAALCRATIFLMPVRPAEVARFSNDLCRLHPVVAGVDDATRWFVRSCGLSPESAPGRVLLLRARGRTATEVRAELRLKPKTYGRHVGALLSSSGVPNMATIVSLVMRRAQGEVVPWEGPHAPGNARVCPDRAEVRGDQEAK